MELQERIRERAYEIWNTSGRMHGQADLHWLTAEREILAEMTDRAGLKPAPASTTKPAPARQRRAAAARAQMKKVVKM